MQLKQISTLQNWNAQYQNQPYEDILLSTLPRHDSSLKWLQFLGIWLWNQQKKISIINTLIIYISVYF